MISKVDALGQRQVAGIIDGVGLTAHIILPAIAAAFPSSAAFLLASKRPAYLGSAGAAVDIGDAAITAPPAQELLGFAHVVGENGGSQPLADRIVQRERLGEVPVRNQVEQRRKGFLLNNGKIVLRRRQAGRHVAAARIFAPLQTLPAKKDFPALTLQGVNRLP